MARLNNSASAAAGGSSSRREDEALDGNFARTQDTGMSGYDDDDSDVEVDLDQSLADRRQIQRDIRNLIRQTTTEQTKFLDVKAEAVNTVLNESSHILRRARQPTEAAIDANLVVRISELAYKRTTHFLADRTDNTGINLDDFVTRCKDYMRFGRGIDDGSSPDLTRAQRKRRRVEAAANRCNIEGSQQPQQRRRVEAEAEAEADDASSDSEEDEGGGAGGRNGRGIGGSSSNADDALDWTHFGQYACLPRLRRPGLARFLPRVPLSAEEKTRVMRKRTAALRLNELQEVRPQVLRPDDLSVSQNSDLTALATDILQQLRRVAEHGQAKVERAYEQIEGGDEDGRLLQQIMDRYGIRSDGGVDLIRFAVNPNSFAQTVENFFYISFLVRDGRVGLAYDDNGLPSIYPISDDDNENAKENAREEDTRKHQLIMSMDMATWREIIETFHIRKPMIAHRETSGEAHPGGRAWFS